MSVYTSLQCTCWTMTIPKKEEKSIQVQLNKVVYMSFLCGHCVYQGLHSVTGTLKTTSYMPSFPVLPFYWLFYLVVGSCPMQVWGRIYLCHTFLPFNFPLQFAPFLIYWFFQKVSHGLPHLYCFPVCDKGNVAVTQNANNGVDPCSSNGLSIFHQVLS